MMRRKSVVWSLLLEMKRGVEDEQNVCEHEKNLVAFVPIPTAFAAITISSEADNLIVVGSERPKGYR